MLTDIMTEREVLRAALLLSPSEQHRVAFQIAENIGYVLSKDAKPMTLAICVPASICNASKGPCDWSGWIDFIEPTTSRITGGSACCKTCGILAIEHSLRYGE